jgi:hypothetical protein
MYEVSMWLLFFNLKSSVGCVGNTAPAANEMDEEGHGETLLSFPHCPISLPSLQQSGTFKDGGSVGILRT